MRANITSLSGWSIALLLLVARPGEASSDLRLVEAAKARDAATVRKLLSAHVAVNTSQPDGATALHWTVHWDDLDTTALLIRAGADVNAANDYGVTPLMLACANRNAALVEQLLKAHANVDAVPSTGEPPLMTAAWTGDVRIVEALVAHGANVNAKEPSGQTALMWTVTEGHLDVARALIAHGANVRAHSIDGFTPLLFAAREGNLEAARMLLTAGADANETGDDGSSVLLVATVRGHVPLASFLLDHGADPDASDAGYTALHWAVTHQESEFSGPFGIIAESGEWSAIGGLRGPAKLELLNALLAHGANPNVRLEQELPFWGHRSGGVVRPDLTGATPFLLAAKAGDAAAMRILLAHGADPKVSTYDKTTPLIVAAGYGRVIGQSNVTESGALEAVKLMLELGADVNAVSALGETPLHGAAYQGWDTIVQLLVEKGARVNLKNKLGHTPLSITEGNVYHSGGAPSHPSTADLLRKLGATPTVDTLVK